MANHLFATSFGQCNCRWCGKRRTGFECPVTYEMRYALKLFARSNGRTWKAKLRDVWESGELLGDVAGFDLNQPLRALRNIIGPRGLMKIASWRLDDVKPPPKEAP